MVSSVSASVSVATSSVSATATLQGSGMWCQANSDATTSDTALWKDGAEENFSGSTKQQENEVSYTWDVGGVERSSLEVYMQFHFVEPTIEDCVLGQGK